MSIRAYKTIKKCSPNCISKKVLLDEEVFNIGYDFEILVIFKNYGMVYTNENNLGEMEISKQNIKRALKDNIGDYAKSVLNCMLDDLIKNNEEWFVVTTL